MELEDMDMVLGLKQSVGWNQSIWDITQFLKHKEYCLVAEDLGVIVGTAMGFSYGSKLAWIGMVMVAESHRRQGISKQLLKILIDRKRQNHDTIKLDATPEGKLVYERMGFLPEGEFIRMVRPVLSGENLFADDNTQIDTSEIKRMLKFDMEVMGYSRAALLEPMMWQYPEFVLSIAENDNIKASLMGRKGSKHAQLGPLLANSDEEAVTLIESAIVHNTQTSYLLDIDSNKVKVIDHLKQLGFTKERGFTRMYLGTSLLPAKKKSEYLIIGPEFG